MELFVIIVNGLQPLTIFEKSFMLDVWMGSEYVSEDIPGYKLITRMC